MAIVQYWANVFIHKLLVEKCPFMTWTYLDATFDMICGNSFISKHIIQK